MISSQFEYNEIQNSPTTSKKLHRKNVFNVQLINNTSFEIIVGDRLTGDIRVPSKGTIEFKGHPYFTTDLNYTVRFNNAAPATDLLIILTSQTNGKHIQQCPNQKN